VKLANILQPNLSLLLFETLTEKLPSASDKPVINQGSNLESSLRVLRLIANVEFHLFEILLPIEEIGG